MKEEKQREVVVEENYAIYDFSWKTLNFNQEKNFELFYDLPIIYE